MNEIANVSATSETGHRFDGRILHARQDLNLRLPVLETGVLAARPRTHRGRRFDGPVKRKAEALIPIAEATNGVRSRARAGRVHFPSAAADAAWCPQPGSNRRFKGKSQECYQLTP